MRSTSNLFVLLGKCRIRTSNTQTTLGLSLKNNTWLFRFISGELTRSGQQKVYLLRGELNKKTSVIVKTTTEGIALFFTEVHLQHFHKNTISSIEIIGFDVGGDLGLPLVAVVQQLLLVVEKLLVGLRRELKVRTLDDGIDRAGLLTKAAVDAPESRENILKKRARPIIEAFTSEITRITQNKTKAS